MNEVERKLRAALHELASELADWGAYAGEYFKEKWDLDGTVARFHAIADSANADDFE